MYEYGFPFDNAGIDNLDRNASSDEFSDYLEMITGMEHGVYPNPSTGLQVIAGQGMSIVIKSGGCIIKGKIRQLKEDIQVSLYMAENLDRIDRIVMRLDRARRHIVPYVIKGTAATSPVAPAVTRSGDIYDIALADVYITKLSMEITQSQITDLRSNKGLCGYMPVFGSFDTTSLFNQYQDALNRYLDLVGAAIDDTMAGHLQTQIDDIRAKTLDEDTTIVFDIGTMSKQSVLSQIENTPKNIGGNRLVIRFEGSSGAGGWTTDTPIEFYDFNNGELNIYVNDTARKHIKLNNISAKATVTFSKEIQPTFSSFITVNNCVNIKLTGRIGRDIGGVGNIASYDSNVTFEDVETGNVTNSANTVILKGVRSKIYLNANYQDYSVMYPGETVESKAEYCFDLDETTVHIAYPIQDGLFTNEYKDCKGSLVLYPESAGSVKSGKANLKLANDTGIGYVTRQSYYSICGNLCTVMFDFTFNGTVPASPITLVLSNLPAPPAFNTTMCNGVLNALNLKQVGSIPSPQTLVLMQNGLRFDIYGNSGTSRSVQAANTTWLQNSTRISGTFQYLI